MKRKRTWVLLAVAVTACGCGQQPADANKKATAVVAAKDEASDSFTAAQVEQEKNRAESRALVDAYQIGLHWTATEDTEDAERLPRLVVEALRSREYKAQTICVGGKTGQQPNDEFEKEALSRFPQTIDSDGRDEPPFVDRMVAERNCYEYYQPVYATKQVCVTCHNAFERGIVTTKGDLMGVVKISLPIGK